MEYVFIRVSVFGLRIVTPVSVAYTVTYVTRPPGLTFNFPVAPYLFSYTLIETVFYLFVYLPRKIYLQTPADHPNQLSTKERETLFNRCADHIADPDRYLTKWFQDAPLEEIKRENLKDFFRWGFFNSGEVNPADEDELNEYVNRVERQFGRELEPGRGMAVPLRLTIDRFTPQNRPAIWYTVCHLSQPELIC